MFFADRPYKDMTHKNMRLADGHEGYARPRTPVSAVVLTYNNEDTIERCLRSLMFCQETIVVDSGSTDSTIEVCERYGARVFHRKLDAFDAQRNFGAGEASASWILAMDSDEAISPGLAHEITRAVSSNPPESGFGFHVVIHFLGRPMPHRSGPSGLGARLYRKERGQFVGEVHERVLLDGRERPLMGSALHYCQRSISVVIRSYNDYTDRETVRTATSGAVFKDLICRPLRRFIGHYLIRGGWRQGTHGFVKCVLDSFYLFLVAAKEWERKQSAR